MGSIRSYDWEKGLNVVAVTIILIPLFLCIVLNIFSIFQTGGKIPKQRTNLGQLQKALLIYSADSDGRLPFADSWMDGIWPYQKDFAFYVNPNEPGTHVPGSFADRANGRYGFAFVRSLQNQDLSKIEEEQVVLFPSKTLDWNSNGRFENFSFNRPNKVYAALAVGFVRSLDAKSTRFPGPDGRVPNGASTASPQELPLP